MNDAIEKYKKYLMVTRSKGIVDYYKGKIGILSQYLGYMKCEDITEDILLDFIIKQRERNIDISNRTLNKYIGTLRQTLRYACKIEINFDKLPEVNKIINTIPLETIHVIFNYYRRNQHNRILQRNYIMFRLFHETGLRLNELLNLKVNDFNF
ncbi:phage integrase SAM-like domain-containing protein [Candidatus Izimaplasma bacterium ZiA1]|uniref:phage integrase SAM-like domain-containing protein n=1 Tax=Candidatus Izimoplasma sp. ZiA1 TaxID=2024899 RepID=UPI001F0AC6A4